MVDINVAKKKTTTKSESTEDSGSVPSRNNRSTALIIAVVVMFALSIGTAAYFYMQYKDVTSDPSSAVNEKNKVETEQVLTNLKKTLLVTEKEAPTVARVEDPSKLKKSNAEFYKDVQKGDYLIIFPKRAVIYRQGSDQIINIAPIINTSEIEKKAPEGTEPADNQ